MEGRRRQEVPQAAVPDLRVPAQEQRREGLLHVRVHPRGQLQRGGGVEGAQANVHGGALLHLDQPGGRAGAELHRHHQVIHFC